MSELGAIRCGLRLASSPAGLTLNCWLEIRFRINAPPVALVALIHAFFPALGPPFRLLTGAAFHYDVDLPIPISFSPAA